MNENEKELIEKEADRYAIDLHQQEWDETAASRVDFEAGAQCGYNLAKQSVEQEVKKLKEELDVTEKLLAERQRLLDEIPECPLHGSCVPNAILWVKKHKGIEAKELRSNPNQTSK